MQADKMVAKHGSSLIGRTLITSAMGDYPGGLAKVTQINPDPAAPEISIQVEHPSFGSIGIFENELVWWSLTDLPPHEIDDIIDVDMVNLELDGIVDGDMEDPKLNVIVDGDMEDPKIPWIIVKTIPPTQKDPHQGQVYNPYTDRWSWI